MSKYFIRTLALTLLFFAGKMGVQAQTTVNTSLYWTTGWCTICNSINSGQYACQQGSGSPAFNNGIGTFANPVPAGNNVTLVCATVTFVCCGLTSMTVNFNGVSMGTLAVPGGCNCNCGNCYSLTFCVANPPNYNYAGNNTIQVVNNGGNFCLNAVSVAITYVPACNNQIANNNITAAQTLCSTSAPAALTGSSPSGGNGIYAYQWVSSNSPTGPWTAITGATTSNYAPPTLNSSVYYRRRVFSQPGCVDTTAVLAIIINTPPANNTIGTSQTICNSGSPTQFTGTLPTGGNGTSYVYSWESSTNNINWTAITGAVGQNYQYGSVTQTLYFRRIVTSGVCPPSTSNAITITLYPRIGNNTATADQTICTGSVPGNLVGSIPSGGSGNYTFQWQSSTDNTIWANIAGAAVMNYQPPVLIANMYYRRIVTSAPCLDTSNVVRILVSQLIGNNLIIADQTICAGVTADQLSGSVPTGGLGNAQYSWESSPDALAWSAVTGNQINYSPGPLNLTTYYRRIVGDGPCPPSTSNTVKIQVDLGIGNNFIGSNQTICEGTAPVGFTGTNPNGGNGTYSYAWISSTDNIAWTNIFGQTNANYASGTLMLTSYFIRVVNSGVCLPSTSNTVTVTVEMPIGPSTVLSSQTLCDGSIPAMFTASLPSGGSGVYSYSWESSIDNAIWANMGGPGNTINDGVLNVNTYYRVTVSSGTCPPNTGVSSNVLVNPIPTVNVNNALICFGQAALLTANPNIPGGTYSWNTLETTQIISVAPAVTTSYSVVYTLNNCPSQAGTALVTVSNPAVPNLIPAFSNLCPGGSVTLTSDPGVSYSWSHNNGLNSITATVNNTGTYNVTVTDVNGCIATSLPVTVTVHTAPLISTTGSDVSCFGLSDGSATSSVVNGTPPFNYVWNTTPVQNTPNATGLPAGTHNVQVTDLYGCMNNTNVVIYEPTILQALGMEDYPVDCFGGANGGASAFGQGGTPPYTYSWSTNPVQNTIIIKNLASTFYIITITDAHGCSDIDSVHIAEPNPLVVSQNINDARCYGESNGAVSAIVNGGTPNYFYSWNSNPVQTTPSAVNLKAGAYSVTVTDGNGCTASSAFVLDQPDTLIARAVATDVICSGQSNGAASGNVTGGNKGGINYLWNSNPPQSTIQATGIPTGHYIFTAWDNKGCVDTAHVFVPEPRPLPFPTLHNDSICPGEDALLGATAEVGLKLNWYYDQYESVAFLHGNSYKINKCMITQIFLVEAEDSKGCKTPRFPVYVWVYNPPVINFEATPTSAELPDAIINFAPVGTEHSRISSWAWNFGDLSSSNLKSPVHQYNEEGRYNITLAVVDSNGCRNDVTKKEYVEIKRIVNIIVPNAFSPNGDGHNDCFKLAYLMIGNFKITIFDRWGEQVYTSQDPNFCWDGQTNGKDGPEATYTYIINGVAVDGSPVQRGGTVTLIR